MGVNHGGIVFMSSFSINFDLTRPCRYVFESNLWNSHLKKFSAGIDVLLDTGSFNTVVHKDLVVKYGVMTSQTMKVSIGGFVGEANICVLHKLRIGGYEIEKVVALAVSFDGELKNHILLGANVLKNWKFSISHLENRLDVDEQFSEEALARKYPYRYCFNRMGQVMALQEFN